MAVENYVYEFVFTDIFTEDIFNVYPDKTQELAFIINDAATKLGNIVKVQQGIRQISSFPLYNGQSYKVTIKNSQWINPIV